MDAINLLSTLVHADALILLAPHLLTMMTLPANDARLLLLLALVNLEFCFFFLMCQFGLSYATTKVEDDYDVIFNIK